MAFIFTKEGMPRTCLFYIWAKLMQLDEVKFLKGELGWWSKSSEERTGL